MDQFDKETDKAHNAETNGGGDSDLLEFFAVGFGATFYQTDRVLGESASRFTEFHNFIHGGFLLRYSTKITKKKWE